MKINVYNENDEVIKTSEASMVEIRFGTVRKLMKLLKIDDEFQLLMSVGDAWEDITRILDKVFPDMEEEDWENVKVSELIPILIGVVRYSIKQMRKIPVDEKN